MSESMAILVNSLGLQLFVGTMSAAALNAVFLLFLIFSASSFTFPSPAVNFKRTIENYSRINKGKYAGTVAIPSKQRSFREQPTASCTASCTALQAQYDDKKDGVAKKGGVGAVQVRIHQASYESHHTSHIIRVKNQL
jgi:hypothetical protein